MFLPDQDMNNLLDREHKMNYHHLSNNPFGKGQVVFLHLDMNNQQDRLYSEESIEKNQINNISFSYTLSILFLKFYTQCKLKNEEQHMQLH